MLPYIAEFLGTMILIILGDGVVANVNLNKSGMKGGGTVQITFAWGLAVMLPAFIFGAASGASFNPALTLALAVDGSFDWAMVPGYIIAQFAGAFVGAVIVLHIKVSKTGKLDGFEKFFDLIIQCLIKSWHNRHIIPDRRWSGIFK